MKKQLWIISILLFGILFLNAQVSVPFRVNAGGAQTTYSGNVFLANQYNIGGTVYTSTNTAITPLYRSELWGNFSYDIPIENGYYDIVLHFIELWMDAGGERVFDVKIENNLVINNYDIFQEVGTSPTIKTFNNIQVTDGILNLVFTNIGSGGEVNNPKLSAYEIYPSQGPPPSGGTSGNWTLNNQNLYYTGGNVGIGTTTPDEKLSVNGNIHSKEVRVDLIGWSDFVFAKDYELPTLQEVEQHIQEKGHLKDIPSSEEVEENGIRLGDMNAKLLQKIEELTLYAIEQQKKLESQENQIKEQSKNNTDLNNRLLKLEQLLSNQQQTKNN